MEQYGTGIERIKTKMIEHGLPAPKFELNGNFFKVILYVLFLSFFKYL